MRIVYLEPAKRDLERFREFMRSNDLTEKRNNHILNGMIDAIAILKGNPKLGFSFGARHGYATPYRGFITDPYIVVYEIVGNDTEVRRIYHQREDYIRDILVLEP